MGFEAMPWMDVLPICSMRRAFPPQGATKEVNLSFKKLFPAALIWNDGYVRFMLAKHLIPLS
jgi:hypothetical protein